MRDELIRWTATLLMAGMVVAGIWYVAENADRRAKGEPALLAPIDEVKG